MKYQDFVPFYQKLNYNCKEEEKNGIGPGSCSNNISVDIKAPNQKAFEGLIKGNSDDDPLPWDEDYTVKIGSEVYQVRLEGWYDDCLESRGYDKIESKDEYEDTIKNDFKRIVQDESGWKKSDKNIYGYIPDVNGTDYGVTYIGRPIKQKQNELYDVADFIKLNANCPDSEKNGSGPGSCGGKTSNEFKNPPEFNLEKKIEESNSWVSSKINTPGTVKVVSAPIKKLETVITKAKKEISSGRVSTQTKKELKNTITLTKSNKLSAVEKDAVSYFTGFAYGPINNMLFKKETGLTDKQKDKFNKVAENVKNVINKNKIDQDTTVWRGLAGQSAVEFQSMIKGKKIGDTFEYAGFMSTSPDASVAKRFSDYQKPGKRITLKIDLPADSFAANISKYSAAKQYGETEILIAPEFNLNISNIEKLSNGDKIYHLKYIKESIKQNSTQPLIKLSMKHPGNWSTADSLDTKIKKELAIGVQDVLDVLKSVGYFKEDIKEVALNEAYQKIAQEIFDAHVKLNSNCKEEEKVGSGPGSCSGGLKDLVQPAKVDLHPKLSPGDFDSMLKASKAIRNDKSEPDRVLRRMMAEEVERKFIRETKEAFQAIKDVNDEFIKNSGNDTWNKLSSESQSAIRGYTASDYGVINSALAEGIERPEVALIKAAMKPLEKETILYRGVSFDLPKEVTKFGAIWENKPFASCSTGSFIAEEAALGKLTHDGVAKIPTVLEILTSKNTKGFAVGKNSFHATADAGSEVILDTGTKFQTLSIDKSGGIRKITVRVVDD